MFLESVIGNTPMLQLKENLFLKLEYANLTGSVKDRAALEMILDAERRGLLRTDSTVIEPTSGNMGISLAALAAGRGYSCIIFMPDSMSVERQHLIKAYGAQVELTPGKLGMSGAVEAAQKCLQETVGGWMPNQFENPANAHAHYRTTGPEIWKQTNSKVDIFVAGVGTGGTITGVGRYLKGQNEQIRIVAVEPADSPLLSKGQTGSHRIQGIGANFVPNLLDLTVVDDIICVTEKEAMSAVWQLSRQEGLLTGISSGAAFYTANGLAEQYPQKNVVTLLPDSGMRYLSTDLFSQ